MNKKAQANFLSFSNPIFIIIMTGLIIALLAILTIVLGQITNLLKIFLLNLWTFTGILIGVILAAILGIVYFRDKIAPKLALIGAFSIIGIMLFVMIGVPSIAIATDGVLATVTVNLNMPGVFLGIQTGSISIQSASVTSQVPNSPLIPTPQTFSISPLLLSVIGGQNCNSNGQCYNSPPPLGFIGTGASITVSVNANCNGNNVAYNQANVPESTILSFSTGGPLSVDVELNNLPDHSSCTFTVSLICQNGPTCSSTSFPPFTTTISSTNTGGS